MKLVLQSCVARETNEVEETTETGIDMKSVKVDDAKVFVDSWSRRVMEGNRTIQDGSRLKM